MAKDTKKEVQGRHMAMERTKSWGSSKKRDEKQRKKEQKRLERQEQRLAERSQREKTKAKKEPKTSEPTSVKEGWDKKIRSFVRSRKKNKETKKGFQIIITKKQKGWLRVAAGVSLILVLVIFVNSLVPVSIGESFQNAFSSRGSGSGFPVTVSPSATNYILSVGDDVALLGDSGITLYKDNGKVLFERQHGYSSPAMCSSTTRLMVYDRGGNNLRVENRAKTLISMETEGIITTAMLAHNGCFGVITRGLNSVSEVNTYDEDGDWVFRWQCVNEHIIAGALSDNGRYLAVAALSVESGQAVTTLSMIDTRKKVTLCEQKYKGSTPLSLDMKGKRLVALLSDRMVSLSKSGEAKEQVFEGGSVLCFDNQNDYGTVVVLGMYQDSHNNRLMVWDSKLNELANAEVTEEVVGVSAKGSRIGVLLGEQVQFYSRGGKLKGTNNLTMDGDYILCRGNCAIVLGTDTLQAVYR